MKGWKDLAEEVTLRRVTIAGRITDAKTKQPVFGADLALWPAEESKDSVSARRTVTISDGSYYFMDRQPGDYQVEVSVEPSIGRYPAKQINLKVPADGERRLLGGVADITL